MIKRQRKLVIRKKGRFALVIIMIVILLCLPFYIGSRINGTKKLDKTAANKTTTEIKKEKLPTPSTDENMNLRESEANNKQLNIDSSTTDVYKADGHKTAYITFDDGPSENITPGILDILDSYSVKATFFLIGNMAIRYPDIVKREVADGQSIGNHTYSHDYKNIYANTNAFISDVNKCDATLKSILGNDFSTKIVRFPGGSFGRKLKPFRDALKKDGYHYIDWNDLTGDADGQNVPVDKLIDNLKKNTNGKEHVVILMHDASTKETTIEALPKVIDYLKTEGYSFNTLK